MNLPNSLNIETDRSKGTVLTRLGDRALQFLALKLAYQVGMLAESEITPDNPAIAELRELVKGLDSPQSN